MYNFIQGDPSVHCNTGKTLQIRTQSLGLKKLCVLRNQVAKFKMKQIFLSFVKRNSSKGKTFLSLPSILFTFGSLKTPR